MPDGPEPFGIRYDRPAKKRKKMDLAASGIGGTGPSRDSRLSVADIAFSGAPLQILSQLLPVCL